MKLKELREYEIRNKRFRLKVFSIYIKKMLLEDFIFYFKCEETLESEMHKFINEHTDIFCNKILEKYKELKKGIK